METLFDTKPRQVDELLANALAILDLGFDAGAECMLPLFSGGHDSLSACHIASQHPRFMQSVHHIDTTIGAKKTRAFVEEVCRDFRWSLRVWKSNFSYEKFIRRLGFPGPGAHQWVYNKLKDRCVATMTKGGGKRMLVTGCRQQESTRRMGHVEPVKVGETSKKTGITRKKNRVWVAPCFDWSVQEQRAYMHEFDLPRNPIKEAMGMSGECFCGAFASPGELERIRFYAPDVADEIDRLSAIAKESETPCVWGVRADGRKGLIVAQTGPLCTSCDIKAKFSGLLFEDM